jgi:hypothetical protein
MTVIAPRGYVFTNTNQTDTPVTLRGGGELGGATSVNVELVNTGIVGAATFNGVPNNTLENREVTGYAVIRFRVNGGSIARGINVWFDGLIVRHSNLTHDQLERVPGVAHWSRNDRRTTGNFGGSAASAHTDIRTWANWDGLTALNSDGHSQFKGFRAGTEAPVLGGIIEAPKQVADENLPFVVRGRDSNLDPGNNDYGRAVDNAGKLANLNGNLTVRMTWRSLTPESSLFDMNGVFFELTDPDGTLIAQDQARITGGFVGSAGANRGRLNDFLQNVGDSHASNLWDTARRNIRDIPRTVYMENAAMSMFSLGAWWHMQPTANIARGIYDLNIDLLVELAPNYPYDFVYVKTYMGPFGDAEPIKVARVVNAFDGTAVDLRVGVGFDFVSYSAITVAEVKGQEFVSGSGATMIDLGIADAWYTEKMDRISNRYTFGPISPRVDYLSYNEGSELTATIASMRIGNRDNGGADTDRNLTPGQPQVTEMNHIRLTVTKPSAADTLSTITVKFVEIHPTMWNSLFPVWQVTAPTQNYGQLQFHDELGIVGRVVGGRNTFFLPDGGTFSSAPGTPRAAWGYVFAEGEEVLRETYNPLAPVMEFSWDARAESFTTYKLDGVEKEVPPTMLPVFDDGTWYVSIRFIAQEVLGARDTDLMVIPGALPESVAGAVVTIPNLRTMLTLEVNRADVGVQSPAGSRIAWLRTEGDVDVPTFIHEGRFMIPLRGITQLLGLVVEVSDPVDGVRTATINPKYK